MLGEAFGRLEKIKRLAPAAAGGHLGVRHGLHVGLGDQQLSGRPGRQGDRPNKLEEDQAGLPGALRSSASSSAPSSWSTRIIRPARAAGRDLQALLLVGSRSASAAIESRYGVKVVKKSFKKLGADRQGHPRRGRAARVGTAQGQDADRRTHRAASCLSAVKIYMAVKAELDADPDIMAVGHQLPERIDVFAIPPPAWPGTSCMRTSAWSGAAKATWSRC